MELPDGPFEGEGVSLAHRLMEAGYFSGDFYNVIVREDGGLGIYLVDIEGHGFAAAAEALRVKDVLSKTGIPWSSGDGAELLETTDRLISEELATQQIAITISFTEINTRKMEIFHANAGMPCPLLFRWNKEEAELLESSGSYVGAGYTSNLAQRSEARAEVKDKDILVLFSDGITEARDSAGRLFGRDGIIAAVANVRAASPGQIADCILSAARAHAGKDVPEDDQTLIVLKLDQRAQDTSQQVTLKRSEVSTALTEFRLRNASDTGRVSHERLRVELRDWAISRGYDDQSARKVWAATWEAIQNAIKYGSERGEVLRILLRAAQAGVLEVEIIQPRAWRDWESELSEAKKNAVLDKVAMPDVPALGGTAIMLLLATKISVSHQGRNVTMRFSLDDLADAGKEVTDAGG